MTWLMEILRFCLKEQSPIKSYPIKRLIFQLASMVYKLFDKISSVKSRIMPNQQLPKELHKPIIRKFGKRKVYSFFQVNICGADLADIQ